MAESPFPGGSPAACHLGDIPINFRLEFGNGMVCFLYVGYRHEANVFPVDAHLYVDYDYD